MDLIERLREQARHYKVPIMASHSLEAEAADEIERLREALDGVRFALGQEPPHVTSAWMLAHSELGVREAFDE